MGACTIANTVWVSFYAPCLSDGNSNLRVVSGTLLQKEIAHRTFFKKVNHQIIVAHIAYAIVTAANGSVDDCHHAV